MAQDFTAAGGRRQTPELSLATEAMRDPIHIGDLYVLPVFSS